MLRPVTARTLVGWAMAAALALVSPVAVQATIVLGNLDGTWAGNATGFEPGFLKAVGFTVPSGPYYSLNSFQAGLLRLSDTATDATVELWSDASGVPGSPIVTIGTLAVTNTSPAQVYTFAPAAPVLFAPATTYWFVVSGTGFYILGWDANSAQSYPVDSTFAFDGYRKLIPGDEFWTGSGLYNAFAIDAAVYRIPTETTLGSAPNPALPGSSITLSALVAKTEALDGAPTGTVTFSIDGVDRLPPVPIDGAGAAELLVFADELGVGEHGVVARYSGDTLFAPSESAQLVQVVATIQEIPTLSATGLALLAALVAAVACLLLARRRSRTAV